MTRSRKPSHPHVLLMSLAMTALSVTALCRAEPPDAAQIINLSPQAQQQEIDFYVAKMRALLPDHQYPDPFKLTPKPDVGHWTFDLDMGEADGSPVEILQYPPRVRQAIFDLHKRMGADVSCSLDGAPGYWEEALYKSLNEPNAPWRSNLAANSRWESRRLMTEAIGLRWMPWRWGGLPGDLKHHVSDKGVISNSHASLCASDPNNVARWVKALAAYGKMGKDWMWQVHGKPVAYWDAEDGISAPGRKDANSPWQFFCYCDSCKALFREWLQRRYGDASPGEDTNGDGATFNGHCGTTFAAWADVQPPSFEQREQYPVFFWEWMKFRDWSLCVYKHTCIDRAAGIVNYSQPGCYSNWGLMNEGSWTGQDYHLSAKWAELTPLCAARHGTFWATTFAMDSISRKDRTKTLMMGFNPRGDEEPFGYYDTMFSQIFCHVTGINGLAASFWSGAGMLNMISEDFAARWYPEHSEQLAWWKWFGEKQHELLKDLQTPQPKIAVLFPRTTAFFADTRGTPYFGWANCDENIKLDRWTDMAFGMLGYHFHLLDEEQVLDGMLKEYKVLYLLSADRLPASVLQKVQAFYDAGGSVVIGYNSATTGLDGKKNSEVFEHILGVRPKSLKPSVYLTDEPLALKGMTGSYTITADHPALPPKGSVLPCVNGMMTVETLAPDVKVLATFNGEPCITIRDRALFIGTRIGVDIAMLCPYSWKHPDEPHQLSISSTPEPTFQNMLKVLHGFADQAGAAPLADVSADGRRPLNLFSGVMENPKLDARIIVLGNYENVERDYAVHFAPCLNADKGQKYDVYELKTNQRLATDSNGELTVFVPNGSVRMLLVAPKAVIDKIAPIQQEVQQQSRLFDFLCARKFFYRMPPLMLPWELLSQNTYGVGALGLSHNPTLVNCMIVLPDKPAPQDEAMARGLQDRIRDWPLGKLPLVVPIKRASEVSLYDRDRYNLLLFGGPACNSLTAEFQHTGALTVRNPKVGIGNVLWRHWKDGGNVVALMGEDPQARQQQFEAFEGWMKTWMEPVDGYRPKDWWIADLKDELGPKGWTISADGVCDLVAKRADGKEVHVFLQQAGKPVNKEELQDKMKQCQAHGVAMALTGNRGGNGVVTDGVFIEQELDRQLAKQAATEKLAAEKKTEKKTP